MPERIRLTTSDLGEVVVVKAASDSIERARLAHEAEVLSAIEHPNVVGLLDRSVDELTLSYAGRSDLAHAPIATVDELARVAATVFTTIGDVSEIGWAHHSIGPTHVIIGERGKVSLCGWGRARVVHSRLDPAVLRDVADAASMLRLVALELDADSRSDRRRIDGLITVLDDVISIPTDPRKVAHRIDSLVWDDAGHRVSGGRTPRRRPAPRRLPSDRIVDRAHVHDRTSSRNRRSELVGQFALVATCAAVLGLLLALGAPGEQFPGSRSLPAGTSLINTGMRVVWWMAIASSAYGGVVAFVGIMALTTRRESLSVLQRRLAPVFARRALVGITGLGVIGASINTGGAAGGVADNEVAAATAEPVGVVPSSSIRPTTPAASSTAMPVVPDPATTSTSTTTTSSTTPVSSPTAPPTETDEPLTSFQLPTSELPPAPDRWVIGRGDHLWRIAEQTVAQRLGRPGTDAEIGHYWHDLIEVNRSVLADPHNPDLVFAGQTFVLPPLN